MRNYLKSTHKRSAQIIPSLMILPYVCFMFFCGIIPIAYGILEVRNPSWVNMDGGYETFLKVLQDFRVGPALINVFFIIIIFVPLMAITVLSISLLLDATELRGNALMRLLFLIPALIPTGVAVLFWVSVVGPDVVWDNSNIRWFIGSIAFSTGIGSWIVIQYGSLRSIPPEVLEAGIIDGCNRFQLAIRLKLPMISRYVAYMVILLIVSALQIFNEPNLLMFTNMTTDWSLSQIAFSYAFKAADFAGSSALSIMILIPNIILALLFVFFTDFIKKSKKLMKPIKQDRNSSLIKITLWFMAFLTSIPFLWLIKDAGRMIFAPIIYYDNGIFFVWLKNTSIFVGSALLISVLTCVTAGFVMAVLNVPFRRFLLFSTLVTMLIPITAMAMPLYVLIDRIHLNNTLLGLILASSYFPFGAFLSYLYYSSVLPQELIGMGRIDGLTDFGIYRHLGIPLSKSLISIVTFFSFVGLWNSYQLPRVLLIDPSRSVMSIGIEVFYGQGTTLIGIMMLIPSVLLYLASQKTIARGIFSGAMKG